MNAQSWIKKLALCPHPEGGYFRETYRSAMTLPARSLPARFKGNRVVSTAIYFLLKRGQVSRFHRIRSDELWHHYAGGSLHIHCLMKSGCHDIIKLGRRFELGEQPQAMVPAGTWFGAVLVLGASYALVGCTVAPGFDFADFEMADPETLQRAYPRHKAIIKRLSLKCGC